MLEGYKTYIAAGAAVGIAVCTNIIEWCNGQPINIEVTIGALTALALIFLRKGVKNGKVE
jgi:uncharacterized protein YraI